MPHFLIGWKKTARCAGGDAAAQTYAIAESCRSKAQIVARDERESGERALSIWAIHSDTHLRH